MKALRTALFFVFLIAAWAFVAQRQIWDSTLFPSPAKVAGTLADLGRDGTLLNATIVSLRRVCLGYAISLGIGLPLGALLAQVAWIEDTVGALVSAFQTLPSICWLPLALLWFGLNDRAILFVIVMGSLVSIAMAVKDGVRHLPPSYLRAARTMGTSPLRTYTEVLIPASQPALLTAAKLGWSYAWRALMSGELLFVSLGLGHILMMGRELADMSQVLAVMIVIMALGLGAEHLFFRPLETHVRQRWGFATS
ncbi:MAG: ABC transporter permease [Armatimonadetes bacterium]|nr:ABC transporter permease subunit [Armatimonadota bacterium]MBS1703607.1 ABC transporter permease [Armatimonadota bacterium]MBS1727347.1 ABC transporter permease [Armatimonadota bacterium]